MTLKITERGDSRLLPIEPRLHIKIVTLTYFVFSYHPNYSNQSFFSLLHSAIYVHYIHCNIKVEIVSGWRGGAIEQGWVTKGAMSQKRLKTTDVDYEIEPSNIEIFRF